MLSSLFRRQKPKKFNYIPRHFDPEKEQFEKRKKIAERDVRIKASFSSDKEFQMRQEMEKRWHAESRKHAQKTSNFRVLLFITIGSFLFYFILQSDLFNRLFENLLN